jgi:hypothetical protein
MPDRPGKALKVCLLELGNVFERQKGALELGGDHGRPGRDRARPKRTRGLVQSTDDDKPGLGGVEQRRRDRAERVVEAPSLSERHACVRQSLQSALGGWCPPVSWTRHLPDPGQSIVENSGGGHY